MKLILKTIPQDGYITSAEIADLVNLSEKTVRTAIGQLREHIRNLREAVEEGVNIFGYTTWGPIDLVSFGTGQMDKRYGFIYVDMNDKGEGDQHRLKKDSFYWYQKVLKSNGEEL